MDGAESESLTIVFLGLSLSSSWGNGHATTYRALLKGLAALGHDVTFLERRKPWYSENRDLHAPEFCSLIFYDEVDELATHRSLINRADAIIVGSFVPDGVDVSRFIQREASGVVAFYDIDTPVTLAKLERGDQEYLSRELIPGFDIYYSFTGGPTLDRLMREFGARAAEALYCAVDPEMYKPMSIEPEWDLGYLGTYSEDRQDALARLLIVPAMEAPHLKFVVAGPLYPDDISWPTNVRRIEHVGPEDHSNFYSRCRFTLNITRADMRRAGFSPSVRLFEAAACGVPIISDRWPGLESVFKPGRDIALVDESEDVLALLTGWTERQRRAMATAARKLVLAEHTGLRRASNLERSLRRHGSTFGVRSNAAALASSEIDLPTPSIRTSSREFSE